MQEARTEFQFYLDLDVNLIEANMVGETPCGSRVIVTINGGTIEGPSIHAMVLPGGGEWFIIRPDGANVMDARFVARTDNGHMIYVSFCGLIITEPQVLERIYAGGYVDPSEYYFRITPIFETAAEKYKWLNRIVTVAKGELLPARVHFAVYDVL